MSTTKSESSKYERVLIVTPVFPPHVANGGGVAITYGALEKQLTKSGAKVTTLSPRKGTLQGWAAWCYPSFFCIYPGYRTIMKLWEAIKACDVTVCPDNSTLPYIAVFSWIHNKPMQLNVHTNIPDVLGHVDCPGFLIQTVSRYFQFCTWMADSVYTTSQSFMDRMLEMGYKCDGSFSPRFKTAVFEEEDDPLDIDRAREWITAGQIDRPTILYAGRWSKEKSIMSLIRAKPKDALLCIVGDGPQAEELVQEHNPAKGIVVRKGIVNQTRLRVLYKASDLFASASKFETLGMSVCESILCGTPVVAERANGFVDQITHGENGFLCYFDDTKAARELMEKALAMKWDRQKVKASVRAPSQDKDSLSNIVLTRRKGFDSSCHRITRATAGYLALPFVAILWLFVMLIAAMVGRTAEFDENGNEIKKPVKTKRQRRAKSGKDEYMQSFEVQKPDSTEAEVSRNSNGSCSNRIDVASSRSSSEVFSEDGSNSGTHAIPPAMELFLKDKATAYELAGSSVDDNNNLFERLSIGSSSSESTVDTELEQMVLELEGS